MKRLPPTFLVLSLIAILVAAGFTIRSLSGNKPGAQTRKVVYYQDSMHPWIKSDQPGKCTICSMDLTPIFEGEKGFSEGGTVVALNSNSITVLNVQTEEVARQPLRRTLRVAGTLEADETRTTIFSAPAAGRIEHLAVEYAGAEVKEGQALLTFYSPELVALRRQYVVRGRPTIALRQTELTQGHGDAASQGDKSQARPRAPGRTGGMMPVAETDPYYADLISPQAGTVTDRYVFTGQYVAEGDRLFTIIDTSVLWLRFDAYEQQLAWLRPGQKLRVTLPALPGREFAAVVAWIEPTLDPKTRSAKVRADLQNPLDPATHQRLLRLGMYAEAQVLAEVPDVLSVRRSAVLLPGGRAYAYLELGPGAYEMRRVKLGRQGDDAWEVLGGLEEGDRVVAAGNVLIDAQAQFTLGVDPAHEDAEETTASSTPQSGSGKCDEQQASALAFTASHPAADAEDLPAAPVVSNLRNPDPMMRMAQALSIRLADEEERAGGAGTMKAASPRPMGYTARQQEHAEALAVQKMALAASARSSPAADIAVRSESPARPDGLTASQQQACEAFLTDADAISQALAADDLKAFNAGIGKLSPAIPSLLREFAAPHPWNGLAGKLEPFAEWPAAASLEEARGRFLGFSSNTVAFAKALKKSNREFTVKIYHCPMAPKPGLWIQKKAPLRNPFYGAEMLSCGKEVAP